MLAYNVDEIDYRCYHITYHFTAVKKARPFRILNFVNRSILLNSGVIRWFVKLFSEVYEEVGNPTDQLPVARFQFHQHFTSNFVIQKCFGQLFSTNSYQMFVIFWRKEIGTKAAHKMLVKLTTELQVILFVQANKITVKLGYNELSETTINICSL
jgi:hypothetical protein